MCWMELDVAAVHAEYNNNTIKVFQSWPTNVSVVQGPKKCS